MKSPKDATEDYTMNNAEANQTADDMLRYMAHLSQEEQRIWRARHEDMMNAIAQMQRENTAPQNAQRLEEMREQFAAENARLQRQFEEATRAFHEQQARLRKQESILNQIRAEAQTYQNQHAKTVGNLRNQNQQNLREQESERRAGKRTTTTDKSRI